MTTVIIPHSTYEFLCNSSNELIFLRRYFIRLLGSEEQLDKLIRMEIERNVKGIKVFWIGEESEIFAGESLNHILDYFFDKEEKEQILKEKCYCAVDLDANLRLVDEDTGLITSKKIIHILNETRHFPNQLSTSYN